MDTARVRWELIRPIVGCYVLLCIVAWLLLVYANDSSRSEAQIEKHKISLFNLRDRVQTDLAIGFDLPDATVIQDRLELALSRDQAIQALEVFDSAGVSRFNTDRGSIGEPIPRAWQLSMQRGKQRAIWIHTGPGETVIGVRIVNGLGQAVGNLALSFAPVEAAESNTVGTAVSVLLIVLCAAIAIPLAIILYGTRRIFARDQVGDETMMTRLDDAQALLTRVTVALAERRES